MSTPHLNPLPLQGRGNDKKINFGNVKKASLFILSMQEMIKR
jgi:hypothetical protein